MQRKGGRKEEEMNQKYQTLSSIFKTTKLIHMEIYIYT
jgi:hypothetical protein